MKNLPKQMWVNVFRSPKGEIATEACHSSYDAAMRKIDKCIAGTAWKGCEYLTTLVSCRARTGRNLMHCYLLDELDDWRREQARAARATRDDRAAGNRRLADIPGAQS